MSTTMEWCTNKLSKLLDEEMRITTLNEIKEHFSSITPDEANETANMLDLPLVFDCLNDSNTEQVDLACEVLSLCMTNLNLGETTNKYSVPLERALNHPYTNVKLMALTELERYITDNDGMSLLCKQKSLLNLIVKVIADKELSVATKSMKILTKIGQTELCVKYLVAQDMIKTFQECMDLNEVVRLRLYEVFINIAKESEGHLNLLLSSGLLSRLLQDLNNNDVLLLMNVLELLSNLVTCNHGYKFLENNNILNGIFYNTDPLFESSCIIGSIKLFGHLAHWKPAEMINKYSSMLKKIFGKICESDLTAFSVAFDTLSYIGETNEGKLILDSIEGNQMVKSLGEVKRRLSTFETPLLVRTLGSYETLFNVLEPDELVELVAKKWFETLGEVPMDLVLKYAKNPFGEIRLAGLGVLLSISKQKWGQELIRNTPGLVEFLLDRTSESIKDCKQAKYDVVTNLASAITIFDHNLLNRLQTFVHEGPYFVETVMEVAVEGND